MPIKRTHKLTQKNWLKNNKNLNILDLGCAIDSRWEEANHFADIFDFKSYFEKKNLKYTQIQKNSKLPFKDKEFDYVILSHVLEHVENPIDFIKEVQRIGKEGYIELPTRLNDSIVIGNEGEHGHRWWFEYDDDENQLLFSVRKEPFQKFVSIGTIFKLMKMFQESFVISLYWNGNIPIKQKNDYKYDEKISFMSLVKKFYSKKLRDFISKFRNK